jgi:hypothetical protein
VGETLTWNQAKQRRPDARASLVDYGWPDKGRRAVTAIQPMI